jgi:hypothetical protein
MPGQLSVRKGTAGNPELLYMDVIGIACFNVFGEA